MSSYPSQSQSTANGKQQHPNTGSVHLQRSDLMTALTDRSYSEKAFRALSEREAIRWHVSKKKLDKTTSKRVAEVFKHFSKEHKNLKELEHYYNTSVGASRENSTRNRYPSLFPYDRTLVRVQPNKMICERILSDHLFEKNFLEETSYLNANWVRESWGGQWYIATEAPLPETTHAFFTLLLSPYLCSPKEINPELHTHGRDRHENTRHSTYMRTIVQLTHAAEGGQAKVHPYFYTSQNGAPFVAFPKSGSRAPPLEVVLKRQEYLPHAHCVKSILRIAPIQERIVRTADREHKYQKVMESGDPVYIAHLHFRSWPDSGVPQDSDRAALVEFAREVAKVNTSPASSSSATRTIPESNRQGMPPIMIHCSAGVGRTGTFIAFCSILRAFGLLSSPTASTRPSLLPASPLGPLPPWLSKDMVAQEVDMLREQRPMMVQTREQFGLIYVLLTGALKEQEDKRERSRQGGKESGGKTL